MKDILYNYIISFIYTPVRHTGANILRFEIDPPKKLHGRHFVGLTFSNLPPIFFVYPFYHYFIFIPNFKFLQYLEVHKTEAAYFLVVVGTLKIAYF